MTDTGSTSEQPGQATARLSGWALGAAIVVLVLFAGLVGFLLSELDAGEVRWSRLTWVFASVEAIAFGAAGALFGSSIQRSRAENAEAASRRHADDAAKGRALAAAVIADDRGGERAGESAGLEGVTVDTSSPGAATRHAEIARALFPDLG